MADDELVVLTLALPLLLPSLTHSLSKYSPLVLSMSSPYYKPVLVDPRGEEAGLINAEHGRHWQRPEKKGEDCSLYRKFSGRSVKEINRR